jgi:hypothetical protein
MNVAGALPESIIVSYQDNDWTQPLWTTSISHSDAESATFMATFLGTSPKMIQTHQTNQKRN